MLIRHREAALTASLNQSDENEVDYYTLLDLEDTAGRLYGDDLPVKKNISPTELLSVSQMKPALLCFRALASVLCSLQGVSRWRTSMSMNMLLSDVRCGVWRKRFT